MTDLKMETKDCTVGDMIKMLEQFPQNDLIDADSIINPKNAKAIVEANSDEGLVKITFEDIINKTSFIKE